MSAKKLIALLVVVVLMSGLFLGLNNVRAKEPVPDLITSPSSIIVMDPNVDGKLDAGVFGIITRIASNYIAIAVDSANHHVINSDIFVFANFSKLKLQITQGVFVKLIEGRIYLYFAHASIIAVPWGELSTRDPAMQRLDHQELVYGKIINVKQTGASESEINHCCVPVQKRTWYYLDVDVATENEQTITMKLEVKVPDYELDKVLNSKGSYLWLSERYLTVYILEQE